MAAGMVDPKDDSEPAPLSNDAINKTVGDKLKDAGSSLIRGMVNLTKSQASKDADAEVQKRVDAKKKADSETLDWMGNPKK